MRLGESRRLIIPCASAVDSIYHDPETSILFASFKYVGYDYAGDMERMRENPKVREWWAMTDSYQEVSVQTPSPTSNHAPLMKSSDLTSSRRAWSRARKAASRASHLGGRGSRRFFISHDPGALASRAWVYIEIGF